MRSTPTRIIAALFLASVAILCVVSFLSPRTPAPSRASSPPPTETISLTWDGLVGKACDGGTVGPLEGFDVGKYIVVNDHLVLRATAEVQNKPPLGSLEGNIADLFVQPGKGGVGVGSAADVDKSGNTKPGSAAISGGGPHGSEIVHLIFAGDEMLTKPRVALSETVIMKVEQYSPGKSSLSLVLYNPDGRYLVYPPVVVDAFVRSSGSDSHELHFRDLPGIDMIPLLKGFDVRSGWYEYKENAGPQPGPGFVPDFQNPDPNPGADLELDIAKGNGRGKGTLRVCYNGQTREVGRRELDLLLLKGATLGTCEGDDNSGGLSGGHFWLTTVTFATQPLTPSHMTMYD